MTKNKGRRIGALWVTGLLFYYLLDLLFITCAGYGLPNLGKSHHTRKPEQYYSAEGSDYETIEIESRYSGITEEIKQNST